MYDNMTEKRWVRATSEHSFQLALCELFLGFLVYDAEQEWAIPSGLTLTVVFLLRLIVYYIQNYRWTTHLHKLQH